ncbi:hypothetical protein MBLNU230_g3915t1 [Neophaeotheca triangularis]
MATTLLSPATRPSHTFQCYRLVSRTAPQTLRRALSTLPNNEHIYIHPHPTQPQTHLLSYLPTTPPNPHLAIGTTPTIPPTPDSLTENPPFLSLLQTVLAEHAAHDPHVQQQASMYASQAGSALGSGGVLFPQQRQLQAQKDRKRRKGEAAKRSQGASVAGKNYGGGGGAGGDGAGGASAQGGMGGAGRGGFVHVSDERSPPDFGRVAWPEDIFGSLELDGQGGFVDGNGRYQTSGTYRMCTRDGILGLSPFLRAKVVEKLRELEGQVGRNG